jgi:DNA mismatch endonuclease, patch repair protein
VRARAHDGLIRGNDPGGRTRIVARFAKGRESGEGLSNRFVRALRNWDRAKRPSPPGPDQEHPLTRLRHTVVSSVEDEQLNLILEFDSPSSQAISHDLPARVLCQRLHVLEAKGPRGQGLHNVQEGMDVLRAWIVRIHTPDHREPLTRRATNNQIWFQIRTWASLRKKPCGRVRAKIGPVGRNGVAIGLHGPEQLEVSVQEAEVQPSGTCIKRNRGVRTCVHPSQFSRMAGQDRGSIAALGTCITKGMPLPYPQPTSPDVSHRMRQNRRRDSGPEIALRSALHRQGLRFKVDFPIRAGGRLIRPDVVFTRARLAVFVDGCFWHCCPNHGNLPRANTAYWQPKLARNVARDLEVNAALSLDDWFVLRIWEHEDIDSVAGRVIDAYRRRLGLSDVAWSR